MATHISTTREANRQTGLAIGMAALAFVLGIVVPPLHPTRLLAAEVPARIISTLPYASTRSDDFETRMPPARPV